jgi:hypothetical protein
MLQMKRVGLGILMMLATAVAGHAQTLGTINGVVKDTQGAVIPGVSVEVASPALIEKTRSAVTDDNNAYGDRLNQFDLRFSRIFKFGEKGTLDANFDIYNAFNSDAVLTETTTYSGANGGAWLLPTSVIVGRIIKFGGRWDF